MNSLYTYASVILTLSTAISYINHRFIKMPSSIAIVSGAILLSLALTLASKLGMHAIPIEITHLLSKINFDDLLLNGMLSFLLFGGGLNINLRHLNSQKWEIAVLAIFSTLASALFMGTAIYYCLPFIGLPLEFVYCLLFGALISPTDPIAVLAIIKEIQTSDDLRVMLEGESLFNDGVGIVLFLSIYQTIFTNQSPTLYGVARLFVQQAAGGILFGMLLGALAYWLIKPAKDYKIEVLLTLVIATGGYTLTQYMGLSGPLAMVSAGIVIGNYGRQFSMSPQGQRGVDIFWELLDEILNAALFLLIGLELLVIPINGRDLIAGCIAIPIALSARYITVATPITLFKRWRPHNKKAISVLTWGGLRGGLAIALALSLPDGSYRNLILVMTYAIVLFAIVVQGLTVKPLLKASVEHPTLPSTALD